jgi:hypothetical protein
MLQGVHKLLVGPLLFRSHGFVSFIFLAGDRPIIAIQESGGIYGVPSSIVKERRHDLQDLDTDGR